MDDEIPDRDLPNLSLADAERQTIPFPSSTKSEFIAGLPAEKKARLKGLIIIEVELRKGQANDCLEAIRNDLIQLSWQYKNEVRQNKSQSTKTRAWSGVKMLVEHWRLQRQLYLINMFAMYAGGGDDIGEIRQTYPFLKLTDCVVSRTVVEPNAPGHTRDQLNWLWRGRQTVDTNFETNNYAVECKFHFDSQSAAVLMGS